jgi:membrane-associated phospholipid phosphatase
MKLSFVCISSFFLFCFNSAVWAENFLWIVQPLPQYSQETQDLLKPPAAEQNRHKTLVKNFPKEFLWDQKEIWTSPFRIRSHDLIWLGPFLGATATLINNDVQLNESFEPSQQTLDRSKIVSAFGSIPVTVSAVGTVYLAGKLTKNDHAVTTGFLGLMALLQTGIVTRALKLAAGRERPDTGDGEGRFWQGSNSFPSGHSASAWALAAVFTEQYPHNPWLRIGMYSYASAVSISRFTGEKHYASDVLVGGAFGYLIGRMVAKQHSATTQSGVLTTFVPFVDHNGGRSGMEVSIQW